MSALTAPLAPGKLGEAIDPQAMLTYLQSLGEWLRSRRSELDELDAAAQKSPLKVPLTADITLAMALWQAVKTREQLLVDTWDSGRVGVTERERLSTLIWGRLDTTMGSAASGIAGLNLSLPEACRLSDALASSLRGRLGVSPDADATTERITTLRATLERLRDQVNLEPADTIATAQARLASFNARVKTITDKVARGGDVGGLLAPLELEASTMERDMIVAGTKRREAAALIQTATRKRNDLLAREPELETLVTRTVAEVDPAPKYAVPQVSALGDIPADTGAIPEYLARLDKVRAAMDMVQKAYGASLETREDLVVRVDALRPSADGDDEATQTLALIDSMLAKRPTSVGIVTGLVDTLEALIGRRQR